MTAICQRARAAHRWSPGCRGGTAALLSSSSTCVVWVGRGQGAGCGVALAGPWLLCPAAPHPSAPHREALSGPAVRGLAAERGPTAQPGSWAGSTVPRCWQHPAEAGSHAEVRGGVPGLGTGASQGWPHALGPQALPRSPRQWGVKAVAGTGSSFVSVRSQHRRRCRRSVAGTAAASGCSTPPHCPARLRTGQLRGDGPHGGAAGASSMGVRPLPHLQGRDRDGGCEAFRGAVPYPSDRHHSPTASLWGPGPLAPPAGLSAPP